MDFHQARLVREALSAEAWVGRAAQLGRFLTSGGHRPGGLLLVGTPRLEPWHLAAHLHEEAEYAGVPELAPVLVRYEVPPGAPPHLRVGLERLEQAGRGETVFLLAPDTPPEQVLERVADARRGGALVLGVHHGGLADLVHEELLVPGEDEGVPFELAAHVVGASTGVAVRRSPPPPRDAAARDDNGENRVISALGRLIGTLSGPPLR